MHLWADIAHFPLSPDYLLCLGLVLHSIKRGMHVPSLVDLDLDDTGLAPAVYSDDDDELYNGTPPDGWGIDEEIADDPLLRVDVGLDAEDESGDDETNGQDEDNDEEQQETRWDADGAIIHGR